MSPLVLLSGLAPAWDPAVDCREVAVPSERAPRDLDGDGVPDLVIVESGSGSGSGGEHIELRLSRAGRVELAHEHSFAEMFRRFPIPEALQGPALRPAREAVAAAMSPTLCHTPDPSLRWLLREPRSLEWVAGPPGAAPPYYVMIDEPSAQWWVYAGHMHQSTLPLAAPVSDGDRTLLPTAHGVVLVEEGRHAWIYARASSAGKLRWPSIERVVLEAPARARIERAYLREGEAPSVSVDLTTGAVTATPRPPAGSSRSPSPPPARPATPR
jgi:hypothetical protein